MKDRFYERNVVYGIQKMENMRKDFARKCRMNLLYTLIAFVLCFIVVICFSGSYYGARIYIPLFASVFGRLFYLRYQEFRLLKTMSIDYNDYKNWMKLQLNKGDHQKEKHLREAVDAYKKYSSDIQANQVNIRQELELLLKTKTKNQILVSVLCGLLFACGDKKYRDVIYKAKYKNGAAGNMVLSAWILYYDGVLSDDIAFEKLKLDFLDFWNEKMMNV